VIATWLPLYTIQCTDRDYPKAIYSSLPIVTVCSTAIKIESIDPNIASVNCYTQTVIAPSLKYIVAMCVH
jgi:hypothetical protein